MIRKKILLVFNKKFLDIQVVQRALAVLIHRIPTFSPIFGGKKTMEAR